MCKCRTDTRSSELGRMASETKLERRLDRRLGGVITPRGAALLIAVVSTVITIGSGLLMRVIDHENFPSLGSGLWWAVQTVTTVGYGDRLPGTAAGQIVAALVMLLGIGFLTVITASITSSFVTRSRNQQLASEVDGLPEEQLRKIDERLARIEAALNGRP
jgi:voltage-gated potassium channel